MVMPLSDQASPDIAKITSIEAVLQKLRALDRQLIDNHLSEYIPFNKAYYVVTMAIKKASDDNYFDNQAFIEKFSVCFAVYYFQAVNDCLDSQPGLATAWMKMRQSVNHKVTPNFILLLMGANAHINHDLPLALLDVMDQQKTDELLKDIVRIDQLLTKSCNDILATFDETGRLADFIKRHLKFLYLRPVMYMVLYWRFRAWRACRAMQKGHSAGNGFKKRSAKTAKRLLRLGNYLS